MSQYSMVFKRYEKKYLITTEQCKSLINEIKSQITSDHYATSTISNLYFDTPQNLLINRSIDKPEFKEKMRMRSYTVPDLEDTVFLELKKKFDGVVYKRRVSMCYQDAMQYVESGKHKDDTQIMHEFDYIQKLYSGIQPTMYIYYDRVSYQGVEDSQLRITLDSNILYRTDHLTLDSGVYGDTLLPEGMVLMEIKVPAAMPLWLCQSLSKYHIYPVSFSKYGMAYKEMLTKKAGQIQHEWRNDCA